MKARWIYMMGLGICLMTQGLSVVYANIEYRSQVINTDAGHIDFSFVSYIKHPSVYQKISHFSTDEKAIDLENGSRWSISKVDLVRGWDKNKNILITQNHANFSTARYAIVNLDLKLAIPASLQREPIPSTTIFVKSVDRVNDIVTLNDGKQWIVHSSDRGNLSKMCENDRVILGVNTGDDRDKSPYILIDTSSQHFVRAHIIE